MDSWKVVRSLVFAGAVGSLSPMALHAQSLAPHPGQQAPGQTAQSRLRPIGAPSAVDAFPAPASSVRQVAMMQSPSDSQPMPSPSLPPSGFTLPATPPPGTPVVPGGLPPASSVPGGFGLPPSGGLPAPLQNQGATPVSPSPALPSPNLGTGAALPSAPSYGQTIAPPSRYVQPGTPVQPTVPRASNDYAAIPAPQLENAFATIDNCRNISAPSTYRAAGVFGCGAPISYGSPVYAPPTYSVPAAYVPPPSQIAPAIGFPASPPLGIVTSAPPVIPGNPGYRPLISFGQEANPVQVGQGLLGQPVAYVPGQRFRNALRYMSF
ncbi:MAG: hypothetical protein ACO1RT_07590 [Planctomycetaceae bacterium]